MKINQGNSQRGAFLILIAFLLPLIMAMLGFVIDFGNVYWHKSVLQNCADASALGGGAYGARNGVFIKKDADKKADDLLKSNQRYVIDSKEYQYLPSKTNPKAKHYYVVTLKEKVPMFFLKYFGYDYMDISASANALIRSDESKGLFPYLFCYTNDLYVVNTIESNNPIVTKNFDGDIVYTNDTTPLNSYDKTLYPNHLSNGWTNVPTSNVKHFYRTKGYKDIYNIDKNDIVDPVFKENLKLHIESLDEKIMQQYKSTRTAIALSRNITSKDLDDGNEFYCYDSTDLIIDNPIKGSINEPIYIYVHESDVFHLKIYADSRRPVVICQIKELGKQWSRGGKLHVDGKNGVTFRGIFYVPDCDELNINEENMNFMGSIVSPSIRTQGKGSYKYENFMRDSGGNNSNSVSTDVSLASDEDIAW